MVILIGGSVGRLLGGLGVVVGVRAVRLRHGRASSRASRAATGKTGTTGTTGDEPPRYKPAPPVKASAARQGNEKRRKTGRETKKFFAPGDVADVRQSAHFHTGA